MNNHAAADRDEVRRARAARQHRSIIRALARAELSADELWLRYFGMGGSAGYVEVDAYVHGIGILSPLECDVLAQTINERLDELAVTQHAIYRLPEQTAAIAHLTRGTLDADVRIHLADDARTDPADHTGSPTLWVPLNVGANQLGALEITAPDAAGLEDPDLRDQCRRLAQLLGHLITHLSRYMTAVDDGPPRGT